MKPGRRGFLIAGGGVFAALALPGPLRAAGVETIEMRGTARGERIWFEPRGLFILPGTVLRFVNRDPINSHTATAYHPDILGRARRIPRDARPWDSGYLLPDEGFEVALTVPGVYDYYCIPHEAAGMVGRIVVGRPGNAGWEGPPEDGRGSDAGIAAAFPAVGDILARHRITDRGPS